MSLIVQKYGGTSVGTPERIRAVARRIAEQREKGQSLAVVVSAMGETTDELIALASKVSAQPPRREMDMLLTTGERVSMALLSMALSDLGVPAISLTGSQTGIITDSSHRRARIQRILGDRVRKGLSEGQVVIVAGFQGMSEHKEITTLGRGGSDTTAVALAAALQANRCEIYTDVDGVYSADPRIVPTARLWRRVRHDQMVELAARGAGVLHVRSVQIAARFGVPLWVLNSLKGEGTSGTEIVAMTSQKDPGSPGMEQFQVTGVTHDSARAWVAVKAARSSVIRALWDRAVSHQLAVHLPIFQGENVSFFIDRENQDEWLAILAELSQNGFLSEYKVEADWVPLSVVGDRLTQDGTALVEIADALSAEHVEVRAGGASPLALTFVVPSHRAADAVKAIHEKFASSIARVQEIDAE